MIGGHGRMLSVYNANGQPDFNKSIVVVDYVDGIRTTKIVHHTGNKPSTYTGNGDTTIRTIDTGGIGNCIIIYSPRGSAIVTFCNSIVAYSSQGTSVLNAASSNFRDGVLTLATDNEQLNYSGETYTYQVL